MILDGYNYIIIYRFDNPRFTGMTPLHLMEDDVKSKGHI